MKTEKHKVLFLDIDGPMIPGRAYNMPTQTKDLVKTFDPCAVGLINSLCQSNKWKIVLHTSWVRIEGGGLTYYHCLAQGLDPKYFHEDAWCDENETWRYTRVAKWLDKHPETTHYFMLDDEPYKTDRYNYPHPVDMADHLALVDFNDGIITSTINKIRGGDWKVNSNDT